MEDRFIFMPKSFIGASVLIVGSGVSGTGAKAALESRGASCFIFDDALYATIPKVKYDYIVVSPSVTLKHRVFEYARVNEIPLIGEIELGYIFNEGNVIAVTGTNGKTTVTELITAMLNNSEVSDVACETSADCACVNAPSKNVKAVACGNIGLSFALTAVKGGYDTAVVEVSSFQLETVKDFKPHIAIITNISSDHLDRHVTVQNYANLKKRIALNQTEEDFLILSQDDIPISALVDFSPRAEVLYTSLRGKVKGAYLLGEDLYYFDEKICSRDMLRLEGAHNVANALSAICAAKIAGATTEGIIKTLTTFTSDAHRLKFVATIGGKNYYNDSKGTNINATVRACECMGSSTCLIAGGSYKGYEYDELFTSMPKTVMRIVAIGQTAKKIFEAGFRNKYFEVTLAKSLREAVEIAADGAEDNILLSPASASFDMFRDYKDRGEQFEKIVLEKK